MKILFINSKNYWMNGWFSTRSSLKFAMDTIRNFGIAVSDTEVSNSIELESLLKSISVDTLVWPNAYYTRGTSGEFVWVQEFIEAYKLPFVGNPVQGLKNMLDKTRTHRLLHTDHVPVPDHLIISRTLFKHFDTLLDQSSLKWPIVIKPSGESCSMGVLKANTSEQARQHIALLFDEFPHSEALLETFLPNEDITCGYLATDGEILLLPTFYKSLELSGKTHVVERDLGKGPWGGQAIIMPPVTNNETLDQLRLQMPKLAESIGISGITRVDARMDENGTLRFFDVNGMPALSYPKSVLVRQVRECFPGLPDLEAYFFLLKTVMYIAARRFDLTIPNEIKDQNLFSLTSGHILRRSNVESV